MGIHKYSIHILSVLLTKIGISSNFFSSSVYVGNFTQGKTENVHKKILVRKSLNGIGNRHSRGNSRQKPVSPTINKIYQTQRTEQVEI